MSLKDLAKQAGVDTGTEKVTKKATPKADEAKPTKTVGDLMDAAKAKAPKKDAVKKDTKPRVKVDDAWIKSLTERANEKFGNQEAFDKATVDFTVAKSKGRFVSLTPKLVYADGTVKSAGPKHRVGFCSNEKWDAWYEKLDASLQAAHSAERKAAKTRKASGQWAAFSTSVKESLGEDVTVKSVSKKLMIKDADGNRVTLKREGDDAQVGSASGDLEFVKDVLKSVDGIKFEEKVAE